MLMLKYFCIRDLDAFHLCDWEGNSGLHLAAENSESVELLQAMLQIDVEMSKKGRFNESGLESG
jgi:hypothetical protein